MPSGYERNGWRWQKTRDKVLRRDGRRCYLCGGEAVSADHVVPVSVLLASGGDIWDESNIAAICKRCHDSKTASETSAALRRTAPSRRERRKRLTTWHERHPNQPREP